MFNAENQAQTVDQLKDSFGENTEKQQQAVDYKLLEAEMAALGISKLTLMRTMADVRQIEEPGEAAGVMMNDLLSGLDEKILFDNDAVSQAMRQMAGVISASDFVRDDVKRAFVGQVGEAFGQIEDRSRNEFAVQMEAAQESLAEQGYDGEVFAQAVQGYHDNQSVENLSMNILNMLPEEVADVSDGRVVGQAVYKLFKEVGLTGMLDAQTTRQALEFTMTAMGLAEADLASDAKVEEILEVSEAEVVAVDLENPGAYRQEIVEAIENDLIGRYGALGIRDGSALIDSMAKSVGYDGQKFLDLMARVPDIGDPVANELKVLYLQGPAREYLAASDDPEQVSGFINSL